MFGEKDFLPDHNRNITIPGNLNKMVSLAETLAYGMPFSRVDFYNVFGKILFGELTFYPAAGFGEFTSSEWDKILGDWLELPKVE